ncbi:hypothetical protein [Absidia glauca]|uniref:Ubiquitin-like domain-containing protein n=1 Tax=Absidia glauca TaxID=4829 RepID=A0A168PIM7_ABSGL|nr:hypothetical protein [Absidia glauca]
MGDFDIASFRERSTTANKTESTTEESAYAVFLKKRKQLGLDDSDSDSDDNDNDDSLELPNKKAKRQQQWQQHQVGECHSETSKPASSSDTKVDPTTLANTTSLDGLNSNSHPPSPKKESLQSSSTVDSKSQHSDSKSPIVLTDDPVVEERSAAQQSKAQAAYTISLDIEDLDPELASLVTDEEQHTASTSSSSLDASTKSSANVPQKIQIKVSYVSLLETVDPAVQAILDTLSKPVKIIMLDNNRFDTLLTQYCKKKHLLMRDMVLVYDNVPVVLRATPASLSMSPTSINRMEVYKRDDFDKKTSMEQEIRAARLSQFNDLAINKDNEDDDDYNSDGDLDYNSDSGTQQHQQQQEDEEHLHIKLRGKDNKDIGLRVKPTTTVENIVKEYHRLLNLDAALLSKIQLSFEGETLTSSMTIADTDLEDEDMVSVLIHS